MRLGFSSMNTPGEVPPDQLGRALEERGFESLWIGEHTHIPTSRKTPYPSGGELPTPYLEMMDPFLSLMTAANATEKLVVGTGVSLALQHDVFSLAKSVSTIDRLSGGRFEFGVGVGWNKEELANHTDVPWKQRYRALEEHIAALRQLWTHEESEFHGKYIDFEPVWSRPKPLQEPHPPVACGMGGPLGLEHAVRWADSWMPIDKKLGDVAEKMELFRQKLTEAGRPQIPVSIVAFGDPTIETLAHYQDLGVYRVVVGSTRENWDDPSTTMPFIDRYAEMLTELG